MMTKLPTGKPKVAEPDMKILYFAWLRDRIGQTEETFELPTNKSFSVADLIDELASRGEGYAAAFEDREVIHVAVDMVETTHDASLANAGEVAFYPPFTGG
jgi:sulfur-carrier protein